MKSRQGLLSAAFCGQNKLHKPLEVVSHNEKADVLHWK
jgi:hypothetical protein